MLALVRAKVEDELQALLSGGGRITELRVSPNGFHCVVRLRCLDTEWCIQVFDPFGDEQWSASFGTFDKILSNGEHAMSSTTRVHFPASMRETFLDIFTR